MFMSLVLPIVTPGARKARAVSTAALHTPSSFTGNDSRR
jgi:hypothetical protein